MKDTGEKNSKSQYGFVMAVILLFVGLMMSVWTVFQYSQSNRSYAAAFVNYHVKLQATAIMRKSVRERAIVLWRISTSDDFIQKSDLYDEFLYFGDEYLKAREKFMQAELEKDEVETLQQLDTATSTRAQKLQELAASLYVSEHSNNDGDAVTQLVLLQDVVTDYIDALIRKNHILNEQNYFAQTDNNQKLFMQFIFSIGMIIIGIAVFGFFVSRKKDQYASLINQQRQDLSQALEGLQKQKSIQDKLFAIIGHELRTPAAAIKMLVDNNSFDKELLRDTSEHLLNVLDDMRVVTHPEKAVEGQVLKTSVKTIIAKAVYFHDMMLQDAGLQIFFTADEGSRHFCLINAQLLRQICLNLLKNCVFHSDANKLWISIQTELAAQNAYTIQFIDNGKGISLNHQKRLFEAFARGDTTKDGTGLGLYLSRKFAREHLNGDLTYADREGGGSVFTLTMMAQSAEDSEIQSETQPELTNLIKGKNILLAEDNQMLQIMSEEVLQNQGATVSVANNGILAMELAKTQDFDLVITDIFMPEMNGYELTEQLRKSGYDKPIIGVTAATIGTETEQILKAGADLALAKPLSIKALNKALAELAIDDNSIDS